MTLKRRRAKYRATTPAKWWPRCLDFNQLFGFSRSRTNHKAVHYESCELRRHNNQNEVLTENEVELVLWRDGRIHVRTKLWILPMWPATDANTVGKPWFTQKLVTPKRYHCESSGSNLQKRPPPLSPKYGFCMGEWKSTFQPIKRIKIAYFTAYVREVPQIFR